MTAPSRGISSIQMARFLRIDQKSARKMRHAIRERLYERNGRLPPLQDIIGMNEAYVGSALKSLEGAQNPPSKGIGNPMMFVAISRDGQARTRIVPNGQRAILEPLLLEWIDPETTMLVTDGGAIYPGLGKTMDAHRSVTHSRREFANPDTVLT